MSNIKQVNVELLEAGTTTVVQIALSIGGMLSELHRNSSATIHRHGLCIQYCTSASGIPPRRHISLHLL